MGDIYIYIYYIIHILLYNQCAMISYAEENNERSERWWARKVRG